MESVVEAMEMAPGALPCLGRVPEQRLMSPESRRWQRRSYGTSSGKLPNDLGFSHQRPFIGGRVMSEGSQGPHTWWWRGQGGTRTTVWCASLLAPLRLSFDLCLVSKKNGRYGLHFVQFREYFLCSFSETQKQQKTWKWYYGISLIG
jgi:hypothetical protein